LNPILWGADSIEKMLGVVDNKEQLIIAFSFGLGVSHEGEHMS
jgi:hypothetical protein